MAASPAEIDRFLQAELVRRGLRDVAAVEAATWLDEAGMLADSPSRPGLPLRNLLRADRLRSGEQRPKQRHGSWLIVRRQLATPAGKPAQATRLGTPLPPERAPGVEKTGHRISMEWMGQKIVTLEDLLRPELRVLCIGINPALVSVQRGHYYQGQSGQRFLSRLRAAGLLPGYDGRWEDDLAFEAGIGQTDVVKRPTTKADVIRAAELTYGKRHLVERLNGVHARLVLFTFKAAATKIFGRFAGHGFISGLTLCGGEVFVMPGPYERADVVDSSLASLRKSLKLRSETWDDHRPGA